MKTSIRLLIVILVFQLTGCAAMFHGTNDQVSVTSSDPEAKLYLDAIYLGKGSGMVTVKRNTVHTVFAKKKGCADGAVQTQTSFDSVSLLGILIDFGLISMLVIDWGATGAMWKTDPLLYSVTPNCPEEARLDSPTLRSDITATGTSIERSKKRTIQRQELRANPDATSSGAKCYRDDRGLICREE